MYFNSINYILFFLIVFSIYWFLLGNNLKKQNILLWVVSYIFYAFWDWRFMFLLLFSTVLDYFTGIKIASSSKEAYRKIWLWSSITINLGFLGFFKYYNFFIESFSSILTQFGVHANPWTLQIILPVGISFYTFHGLSYVIDIFYKRIEPEKGFVNYAVFVSFFPLLVAGPIERATHLLPQIKSNRILDKNKLGSGLRQILWGLFKKVVIADNCAYFVNDIFNQYQQLHSFTLIVGVILFAFQIYGDFSGYSDIALGSARMLGIELLTNFSFPYFSRDIAEFWRRWHISLTTWFRDYVYIPLGGNKGTIFTKVRNTFIIFILSGLWHGANWTFVVWGLLNTIYFLPLLLSGKNRTHLNIVGLGERGLTFREFYQIFFTFTLTCIAWIFFRSNSIIDAFNYFKQIIFFNGGFNFELSSLQFRILVFLLILFITIEWLGRKNIYALEKIGLGRPLIVRYLFYYFLIAIIIFIGGHPETFIYFQF